jgi:hypothetical protein
MRAISRNVRLQVPFEMALAFHDVDATSLDRMNDSLLVTLPLLVFVSFLLTL